MLLSISLILTVGMFMAVLCKRIKLPGLIGMLIAGIILGPYTLNVLDKAVLDISSELRRIALIIILTGAGLGLDLSELKKTGKTAVLMCFLPASLELLAILISAPSLMGLSFLEAAIMGAVLAAVSPAVIVPRMIKLIEEGYGVKKGIPQLILAGATVDDVYVIVLFSTFINMAQGGEISIISFLNIPASIIFGILIGILLGKLLTYFFNKTHINDTLKIAIILSISFLLVEMEERLKSPITFSSLIAIMFIGVGIKENGRRLSEKLSAKYKEMWNIAEIFLFVLVGAAVDIGYLGKIGLAALAVIIIGLIFRMLGLFICLSGTVLRVREKIFTMLAYTPKATVQAAIAGIPLSLGLSCADAVLSSAVLAIVITAPIGAFMIDLLYKRLLKE